ncbi:hypothetical protein [Mycobacteroides abscessus]|uniref:hypothetical protein n=1 Tax=Mycobacteroides abscessus TaxID=36809 RepID=UPI0014852226|nr:hypothetical protein [Mycobacteroides abscessus]
MEIGTVSVTVVDAHDRYGRTVAAIILADDRNYAIEATRAGHAHAYIYNHRPSIWAPQIAARCGITAAKADPGASDTPTNHRKQWASVVVSGLDDLDLGVVDTVDESVFIIDASRPVP